VDDIKQEVPAQQVPAKRRRYADDFKQDAVRLIVDEKYSFKTAAQAVGVTEQTLRTWHSKLAPKPEPCGDDATVAELQAENRRLRRELKLAQMEREILKKATAYFANQSQ
jgi:transposase